MKDRSFFSFYHTIRIHLLCWLMKSLRRNAIFEVNGLKLCVRAHQTNPLPFSFLKSASFLSHFENALHEIKANDQVLEMGAGCALWGLLALQKSAHLSVSDLPGVDLSSVVESAEMSQLPKPTIYQADLFEHHDLKQQKFDHIFFNPPFHFAKAQNLADQAYLGGENGEVLVRFIADVKQVMHPYTQVWLILPQIEYDRYLAKIQMHFHSEIVFKKWVPLLGNCLLLKLSQLIQHQKMPPNAESFYHLSKMINTHSCELIEIKGKIDLHLLKSAIAKTCLKHPITRSKLKFLGKIKGYEWQIDRFWDASQIDFQDLMLSNTDEITHYQISKGEIPQEILSEIWAKPAIDPLNTYPIKFRVMFKSQDHGYLMVIAPHLCTDARAGILLAHDILDQYHLSLKTQKAQENTEIIEKPNGFMSAHDPLQLDEFSFGFRLKLWGYAIYGIIKDYILKAEGFALDRISNDQLKKNQSQRGRTCIDTLLIDEADFIKLKQKSKQKQCTIHTLMTMALIEAQKEWKQEKKIKVMKRIRLADLYQLTTFFKQKEQLNQSFNMLVAPLTLTLKIDKITEISLQHAITEHLNQLKQGLALVEINRMKIYNFVARFLPILWVQNLMDQLLKTETTTTNPGIIPYAFEWQDAQFKVVDVLNFPQIAPPAKLGIIYTTFRGRLRVVFLYDETAIRKDDLLRLQNLLMAQIKRNDEIKNNQDQA